MNQFRIIKADKSQKVLGRSPRGLPIAPISLELRWLQNEILAPPY